MNPAKCEDSQQETIEEMEQRLATLQRQLLVDISVAQARVPTSENSFEENYNAMAGTVLEFMDRELIILQTMTRYVKATKKKVQNSRP